MNKRLLNWLTLFFLLYIIYNVVENNKGKKFFSSSSNVPAGSNAPISIDPNKDPKDYTFFENVIMYFYSDEIKQLKKTALSMMVAEEGDTLILYIESKPDMIINLSKGDINHNQLLGMKVSEFRLINDPNDPQAKILVRLKQLIKNEKNKHQ